MTDSTTCPTCGAALPAGTNLGSCPRCLLAAGLTDSDPGSGSIHGAVPTPEEIAPQFPQLEILEFVGQGGMGVVYKARQVSLDRIVALKILPASISTDPAFASRFTREARTMARLDHPNIVRVHDFGEAAGRYFLLMEYVDGSNLRQLMGQEGLEPREALSFVTQICNALQYAHDQGVVHRDIKPENVLLDRRGRVKITDFGLAKLVHPEEDQLTLTEAGQVMGTPRYMAPEQYRTPEDVDHRADIYSLGVVFYEMLTGEIPMGHFDPPSQRVHVDVRVDEVVLRTLAREREKRYQRVDEVHTAVTSIVNSPEDEDPESTPKVPPSATAQTMSAPIPAEDTRLSRLALFGFLCVPGVFVLPILITALAALLGAGSASVLIGFVSAGLALCLGIGLSIAGWIAIKRSEGALKGLGLAITGTFLPILLLPLSIGVLAASWLFLPVEPEPDAWGEGPIVNDGSALDLDEFRRVDEGIAVPSGDALAEAIAIRARLGAVARRGTVTANDLATYVANTDRRRIEGCLTADRNRLAEADLLGLPYMRSLRRADPSVDDGPLDVVELIPDTPLAWVTEESDRKITYPIIHDDGVWYFGVGPVFRGTELPDSFPSIVEGGPYGKRGDQRRQVQVDVEILWSNLQHLWSAGDLPLRVPFARLPLLLPPSKADTWGGANSPGLAEQGRDGALGMLLLDAATLPAPLGDYTLQSIAVSADGRSAVVTAKTAEAAVTFGVVFEAGRWYFALDPVRR